LVHQRELQLAAFTEHKNASVPHILHDSSELALVPNARDWSVNTSNRASSYTPEADDGAGVALNLHPPQNFLHRIPHSASSSSSLPSSNDNSAPSSDTTLPPTPPDTFSTSMSPTPSFRRAKAHTAQRPRPSSMVSLGTSYMTIRSRPSVRAAPHAPHSNVQIVLPAPLASNLYEQTTGEGARVPSPFVRHSVYSDSWRRSLADTWISVGQNGFPEPEPSDSQHSHDSMEKRSRLTRSSSPGPLPRRSRSNTSPSPLSLPRSSSGFSADDLPQGAHPPVPHIPSEYGTLSGQYAHTPSSLTRQGAS